MLAEQYKLTGRGAQFGIGSHQGGRRGSAGVAWDVGAGVSDIIGNNIVVWLLWR